MDGAITSLLTSLVKNGIFGDVKLVDIEYKDEVESETGEHYTSELYFVKLRVKSSAGEEILHLVIKVKKHRAEERDTFNTREQFQTEETMYKEILPGLGLPQHSYPKLYYSDLSEDSEMYVLIFENLGHRNFRNSKERVFLDMDHITLAVKKIAKFHSLSFILKHKNYELFKEMTNKLINRDKEDKSVIDFQQVNFEAIKRGVKAYRESQGEDNIFNDFLESIKETIKVWKKLSLPEEPFDVICHGDYCNNNVMFKYNDEY